MCKILKSTVSKEPRQGWTAITEFAVSDTRVLRISTSRTQRGAEVRTMASCLHLEGGYLVAVLFHDFRKCLQATPAARVTESAVRSQHARQLGAMEPLLEEVNRFYSALDASRQAAFTAAPQGVGAGV